MLENSLSPLEQMASLKKLGLIIDDEEEAEEFLLRNDAHIFEEYLPPFMNEGRFMDGTKFVSPMEAYLFDQALRHEAISLSLEKVEINFKYSYYKEFVRAHGARDYLNPAYFTNPIKHREILEKADRQRAKKGKYDKTYRYFADDGSPIILPIWDFVKLLTIRDITVLYSISEKRIKRKVADSLGYSSSGHVVLGNTMRGLTFLRNQCAHGSRLFDFSLFPKPYLSKNEKLLLAKHPDGSPDDSHLFAYVLVLKKFLPKQDFEILKDRIISISDRYPRVDMKYYGFPTNWKRML